MWLTSSSIGRKFVMAITGICLVLFVTFHCLMNAVAIVWPTAYNVICEFLGANWYALIASAGLALLFILHIIYASWLTIQNRKARGEDRYAVNSRPPQVEWSSKNMYVLGIVILAFLVVHLIQFWARMQWQEIIGHEYSLNGVTYAPQFGTLFIQAAFALVWTPIVYIIGFVALWFHLNHGIWSMLHSCGWDSTIWLPRLKCIAFWWSTIVVGLFIAQAIVFTVQANKNHYLNDPKLQAQYTEAIMEEAQAVYQEAMMGYQEMQATPGADAKQVAAAIEKFDIAIEKFSTYGPTAAAIAPATGLQNQAPQIVQQLEMYKSQLQQRMPAEAAQAVDVEEVVVE